MKLCLVTRNIQKGDGQSRVNYEIVREAIRRGHQVTLLASSLAPDLQQSDRVRWVPILANRIPTQLLSTLWFSRQCTDWLYQHRDDFDLVCVNGANTSYPADVNAVHFVHSVWLRSPVHPWHLRRNAYGAYQGLFTALNARWEKRAFREAKIIVAVSEKVRREAIAIGVPSDRIRVIVNGVDWQEFFPDRADRRQWGLPENVPLALFAGDLRTPRKNLDTVLKALVQVGDLHLVVVGATDRSPYPQLAANLGLGDRVHFLGYRHDVSAIMKAADLFVFPSRYEACTLVVLEAMASGLPVITAVTAGGSEVVTPECGIVLSDSEDVSALARSLAYLANDCQLRQRMGQAGRAIARQLSWSRQAKRYVDLFEEIKQGKKEIKFSQPI